MIRRAAYDDTTGKAIADPEALHPHGTMPLAMVYELNGFNPATSP